MPPKKRKTDGEAGGELKYLAGFGAEASSEALPGALPVGQNTPQKCPYGLYAEQLNGSAFTAPRTGNMRTWLYRIRPSVAMTKPFRPLKDGKVAGQADNALLTADFSTAVVYPNQSRWQPFPMPKPDAKVDWLRGLRTVGGTGSAALKSGYAIHVYTCNASMDKTAMCNSDGDFLIVPEQGTLRIRTEMGTMHVPNGEICVVQRGIKFAIDVDGPTRGYVLEIFQGHFKLPDLGPIGANGLANPRDFQTVTACFEDKDETWSVVQKFMGQLFACELDHSPFDVVAWHGNYAPYKYDTKHFCVINSVSFDHIDPSIFTVLTAQSLEAGTAVADFVIFPPRWSVHTNTFRPPYYHRNTMTEFMGNIRGQYEAKEKGFLPGGATLHSCMIPHGPDRECFEKASNAVLEPEYLGNGNLAFMFESCYGMKLTPWALEGCGTLEPTYHECWAGLTNHFRATQK